MMAEVRIYSTPPSLFRYRSIDGPKLEQELEAIINRYIFCPLLSEMNDPMEGMHREALSYIGQPNTRKDRKQIEEAKSRLGIASFSEVRDHQPMWAYYADQFKGICVQYSTRALLDQLASDVDLVRLAYNEVPPLIVADRATPLDRAKLSLATKNIRWRSEREWRIIAPNRGQAFYRDIRAVSSLYLGSRVNLDVEQRIRTALEPLKVRVLKMKISKYKIEFSHDGK